MHRTAPRKHLLLGLALLAALSPATGCAVHASDGIDTNDDTVVTEPRDGATSSETNESSDRAGSRRSNDATSMSSADDQEMRSMIDVDCSAGSAYRAAVACTPAVMVVRHAEDTSSGPHALTDSGKNHANLYVSLVDDYVFGKPHGIGPGGAEACACPVEKILAIDPAGNELNSNPSSNPFETIRPLAEALGLPIVVRDASGTPYTSCYDWNTAARQSLLEGVGGASVSTVIAWDKQGLNWTDADAVNLASWCKLAPDSKPLLKKLGKSFDLEADGHHFTPQRNHFFVFTGQDPEDGKFENSRTYVQTYSHDEQSWYTTPFLTDSPKFVELAKL